MPSLTVTNREAAPAARPSPCTSSWRRSTAALLGAALFGAAAGQAQAEEILPPPPLADGPGARTTITVTTQAPPPVYTPPPPPSYGPPPAYSTPPVGAGAAPAAGPMYFNGPVYVYPAPVTAQPVYQNPWQQQTLLPPPPLVNRPRLPPPVYRTATCCANAPRLLNTQRGPLFAMGVRFTATGINQEVFGERMTMMGGGLQLRFRTQGHFGFETAFDVMRANLADGLFKRTSFPFTAGVMLYLFRNRPETHFNVYAIAGVGLQASDIVLYDERPGRLNQQFLELLGHVGGGVELRFNRLALTADVRAVGAKLDESGSAGAYYSGVDGGPIPSSSVGYKANVGTLLWF